MHDLVWQSNSHWDAISNMGIELSPKTALFAGSIATVSSIGTGDINGPRLDSDDFASAGGEDSGVSSVNRDFSGAEDTVIDFDSGDETELMDQSLDPAFAFNESDLEATGDFSQLTDELVAEVDTGVIEFSDTDNGADAANTVLKMRPADVDLDVSELNAEDLSDVSLIDTDLADELNLDELDLGTMSAAAANDTVDELDLSSVADDLTLDLEQLSGDLELDSSELLDTGLDSVEDLEIPDLTGDNDLLSGGAAILDSADEMDTMLDLAKAYIDMGDRDSASSALGEIVKGGSPEQVTEAETLLRKIS